MMTTFELPLPRLSKGRFGTLSLYTDEQLFKTCAVRVAFTERGGGVSEGPFASLNVGGNTRDLPDHVEKNRRLLMSALRASDCSYLVPNQVHGSTLCRITEDDQEPLKSLDAQNTSGVDAILIERRQTAALLCFADCVPIIIVSPSGRFAVVHAGWRGIMQEIAGEAIRHLLSCDKEAGVSVQSSHYNVYIGPYIHSECFEVSLDTHKAFVSHFGISCAPDSCHIDLGVALRHTLYGVDIERARIADLGMCTACNNENFFSYRSEAGICGRQAALGIRM